MNRRDLTEYRLQKRLRAVEVARKELIEMLETWSQYVDRTEPATYIRPGDINVRGILSYTHDRKKNLRAKLKRTMKFLRHHNLTDDHLILARGPPGINLVPKCEPKYIQFVNVMREFDAAWAKFLGYYQYNGWRGRLNFLGCRREQAYDELATIASHCEAMGHVLAKFFPLSVVELIIKFTFPVAK